VPVAFVAPEPDAPPALLAGSVPIGTPPVLAALPAFVVFASAELLLVAEVPSPLGPGPMLGSRLAASGGGLVAER
jgi:hypothetical protein